MYRRGTIIQYALNTTDLLHVRGSACIQPDGLTGHVWRQFQHPLARKGSVMKGLRNVYVQANKANLRDTAAYILLLYWFYSSAVTKLVENIAQLTTAMIHCTAEQNLTLLWVQQSLQKCCKISSNMMTGTLAPDTGILHVVQQGRDWAWQDTALHNISHVAQM